MSKGYPNPVTRNCTEKILEQMNNSIYRINEKEKEYGIFCKIKSKKRNIPVLITSYQVINERNIEQYNKTIKVSRNNEIIDIEYGDKIYINKEYNLSIIEIKNNKKNKLYFLEIDDSLYEKNSYYYEESIYIIHYDNQNEMFVSYGILNDIKEEELLFSCNFNSYSNFSPIFNSTNNKLIGIHNKSKYNGIFLKLMVKEFLNIYKNYKNARNEINIKIQVDKKDIKKYLYFLDNYAYKDNDGIEHCHDNLKELNNLNTELYIGDKKYDYNKYFKFDREGTYDINLKFNINLTDCSYMFAGCENIISINFVSFNTKYITNMKYMFCKCNNLKSINLLLFNTENVIDMPCMFSECNKLNNLDVSSFNTKKVINMEYMFYSCNNLQILNLSSFDTENVINMEYMFAECYSLKDLNVSSFNTKNVKKMCHMFSSCNNLQNLNLSSFDTKIVEKMNHMFNHCINLKYLNLSSFDTKDVTQMEYMFYECEKLEELNLSKFNTICVVNMSNMFKGCNNLKKLILSPSFTAKNVKDMSHMFHGCNNLKELDLSSFNTIFVLIFSHMFHGCSNIQNLNLSSFFTLNVIDMSGMFFDCKNLTNIDFKYFNNKIINNASNISINQSSSKSSEFDNNIPVIIGDTEEQLYNSLMYSHIYEHEENSTNTENFYHDEEEPSSIDKIKEYESNTLQNISVFMTKNVKNMKDMFRGCKGLTKLDLSFFNTEKVTNMSHMFYNCNNLNSLVLSPSFKTQNVIDMSYMFAQCHKLLSIGISSFDIDKGTIVKGIYDGCNDQFIKPKFNFFNFNYNNTT